MLSPPAQLLGVNEALPSMIRAVLRSMDFELVPCAKRPVGDGGSQAKKPVGDGGSQAAGVILASKIGFNHSKSYIDF